MTNTDLKALRAKLGYSMADFAACLGVPKSTFQRYEENSAAIPQVIKRRAFELETIDRVFFAGIGGRVDAVGEL